MMCLYLDEAAAPGVEDGNDLTALAGHTAHTTGDTHEVIADKHADARPRYVSTLPGLHGKVGRWQVDSRPDVGAEREYEARGE